MNLDKHMGPKLEQSHQPKRKRRPSWAHRTPPGSGRIVVNPKRKSRPHCQEESFLLPEECLPRFFWGVHESIRPLGVDVAAPKCFGPWISIAGTAVAGDAVPRGVLHFQDRDTKGEMGESLVLKWVTCCSAQVIKRSLTI